MPQPNRNSNVQVHRVAAPKSTTTTSFQCGTCGSRFSKRYLLRKHEHNRHGLVPQPPEQEPLRTFSPKCPAPCIIVEAIKTAALRVATARREIPFAVLHLLDQIPLIVRVLDLAEYSLLKPAGNSDFRESQRNGVGLVTGSSIRIAIVATLHQRLADNGGDYFDVCEPVPPFQSMEGAIVAPEQDELEDNVVFQDLLASGDMYKTLAELNASVTITTIRQPEKVVDSGLLPTLRPHQVSAPQPPPPSVAATKQRASKRKPPTRTGVRAEPQPAAKKRVIVHQPPPKVLTAMGDLQWWEDQNTAPAPSQQQQPPRSTRPSVNYRAMATTGPLRRTITAAPLAGVAAAQEVEVLVVEDNDPLVNLDMLDLIRMEDAIGVDALAIDIDDSVEALILT